MKTIHSKQSLHLITLWAYLLLFIGCATELGHHTFLKESYPAKPQNSPVDIFTNGLPNRAFDRTAILDVHCESQGWVQPTIQTAIPIFIKEARAAGCDAVIEIQEAKTPENWTLETRVKHYTATGITYK